MSRPAVSRSQKAGIAITVVGLGLCLWTAKNSIDGHRQDEQQRRLAECVADYAEKSAIATAARAELAAQDRQLDESDRQATQANEDAWDRVLTEVAKQQPGQRNPAVATAFANLVKIRERSAATRAANNRARDRNEETRRLNPIPAPPSELCG